MSKKRLGKNILREGSSISTEEKNWEEFKRLRAEELAERKAEQSIDRVHVASESMPLEITPKDSLINRAKPIEEEEDSREEG